MKRVFIMPRGVAIAMGLLVALVAGNSFLREVTHAAPIVWAVGHAIGSATGIFLILYVLWVVGKGIWRGCRLLFDRYRHAGKKKFCVLLTAVALALTLGLVGAFTDFQRQAQKDADGMASIMTMRGNQKFIDAGIAHTERATAAVMSRYSPLSLDALEDLLPENPSLSDLQTRRDGFRAIVSASQRIEEVFATQYPQELANDNQNFATDLQKIGVAQSLLPTIIASLNKGSVESVPRKMSVFLQTERRYAEASMLFLNFLIETYGKWKYTGEEMSGFQTQDQVSTYNNLAAAVNKALAELQQVIAAGQADNARAKDTVTQIIDRDLGKSGK
jgi:hypothetical protein